MHILGQGQKSHVLMYIENEWIRKQVLKDKVLANPKRVNVLELEGAHTFLVFAYPYEDWDKIIEHLNASDNYDNISAEEFSEKGMQNKQRFLVESIPDDRVDVSGACGKMVRKTSLNLIFKLSFTFLEPVSLWNHQNEL